VEYGQIIVLRSAWESASTCLIHELGFFGAFLCLYITITIINASILLATHVGFHLYPTQTCLWLQGLFDDFLLLPLFHIIVPFVFVLNQTSLTLTKFLEKNMLTFTGSN
jgi:hypothetical protein